MQLHTPAAPRADRDPLQERIAAAWRTWSTPGVRVLVGFESPLVGHERLPANVRRVAVVEQHRPAVHGQVRDPGAPSAKLGSGWVTNRPTIYIGPGISWVVQDANHCIERGLVPDGYLRGTPPQRPRRQR